MSLQKIWTIRELVRFKLTVFSAVLAIPVACLFCAQADAENDSQLVKERVSDLFSAGDPREGPFAAGFEVFSEHCASCHAAGGHRIPSLFSLRDIMSPAAIQAALTQGVMRLQGEALSADQKRAVSEFIANRPMAELSRDKLDNRCKGKHATFDLDAPSPFTNWGLSLENTHFIPAEIAGLDRSNIDSLRIKWAYAFPGSLRMRSQPAIAGGSLILGNHTGAVRSLDLETGCERWDFQADAEVRTGITLSPWNAGDTKAMPRVYFGDLRGNIYALNARDGELLWKVRADKHPSAVITAAPALYRNTLYIPISSLEEAAAVIPGYPCCSFRGSVLALDAASGDELWRTFLVDPAGQLSNEKEQYGPSGVPVWNTPAIDVKRGQLYVATGDNYSNPPTPLSDSIIALDLRTGKYRWHYQALAGDAWNVACVMRASGNCPEDEGPDFDFGAGTVLATGDKGREVLLAAQKSGITYAIDPDTGKKIWQTRVGRGGPAGGTVFGIATAMGRAFVPIFDMADIPDLDFPASPGLHALDIASGKILWRAPSPRDTCMGKKACVPGIAGSISVTPELILAGAEDGHIRIYDLETGEILWDRDTTTPVDTVNSVKGHGGAISGGAAPLAYKGKLIVASGYGFSGRMPGNVLLVFESDKSTGGEMDN